MAAQSRLQSPHLTESAVEAWLQEEPFRFDFFQAVRLFKQLSKGGDKNENGSLSHNLTFRTHASTAFPASQIQSIELSNEKPSAMTVNFMGLTGPLGVLPLAYSETTIESASGGNPAMRDFLDLFNDRLIALFYEAWERNHPFVRRESGGMDAMSEILLDLIGLGTAELRALPKVPYELLACYASLLLPRPRSAAAFRQALTDYFSVPVEIEQFAGAWYPIEPDRQSRLDEGRTMREQLGTGALVGDEVWSQQARVRIRLGPLNVVEYLQFLPGGTAYEPLSQLAQFYANTELEFDLQLVLKREAVAGCELGSDDVASSRLGWMTWLRGKPLQRDPDDTVLFLL